MRILVVTQYFWPENFRINDLCAELAQRGHNVTVLTGKPNYPDGVIFDEYKQSPLSFNQYQGCEVVRVPIVARGSGSSMKLILNYVSFALSASLFGFFKLRKAKFDVIFVFEPSPITVALPAIFIKALKKTPLVFWVLDLWPETLEAVGVVRSKKALWLVGKLVSFIYKRCDLILGQSRVFLDGISQYCDDKEKIKYFPSWSDNIKTQEPVGNTNRIISDTSSFKVLFAGNVGEAQDFPSILGAAEILKANNVGAIIFIVGDGRKFSWVKDQVESRNLSDYICLLGRHPLEMMPGFYASADALLVTLRKSKVFSMTIPGKVQSYMDAEK
ncbi:MAG: glycosyltransferase family 4 protein, partial [Candidatus Thioglobus sp.]